MAELAKNLNFDTRGQKGSPSLAYNIIINLNITHSAANLST